MFEDASIDKEVDIRRKILRDFNKTEDDFDSLRAYNDYLEMVEDIIFNLSHNTDILETNKKIAEYKEVNKALIAKNRHKTKNEMIELEDILAEEEKLANKVKAEAEEAEKIAKLIKVQNKEKLIDELMFSDGDAGAIIQDHANKITNNEAAGLLENSVAKFASSAEVAAASRAGMANSKKLSQGITEEKPYSYEPIQTYHEGPIPPTWQEVGEKGYYRHIRPADAGERAAGYVQNIACLRALQEAMCGLYFEYSCAEKNTTQK